MDIQFASVEELYHHIKPALNAKASSMKRNGFSYIKPDDIWNYFKEKKWIKDTNLTICEMVDDIMNTDDMIIDDYLKAKLNLTNRKIYFN